VTQTISILHLSHFVNFVAMMTQRISGSSGNRQGVSPRLDWGTGGVQGGRRRRRRGRTRINISTGRGSVMTTLEFPRGPYPSDPDFAYNPGALRSRVPLRIAARLPTAACAKPRSRQGLCTLSDSRDLRADQEAVMGKISPSPLRRMIESTTHHSAFKLFSSRSPK
jgi:hypothetical protein